MPKPSGPTTAASSTERETPQRAIERIVTLVLGEVFQSHDIPLEVRRRAQEFANKFKYSDATYLGPEARRGGGGQEYDIWIDEIFQATQTVRPRANTIVLNCKVFILDFTNHKVRVRLHLMVSARVLLMI